MFGTYNELTINNIHDDENVELFSLRFVHLSPDPDNIILILEAVASSTEQSKKKKEKDWQNKNDMTDKISSIENQRLHK